MPTTKPAHRPLDGDDLAEIFHAILPDEALAHIIDKARFQERNRKLDAVAFLRAMVIAAGTGYGGRQAGVARIYFEAGKPIVSRSGFYSWFGPELDTCLGDVAHRALEFARREPIDLPRLLSDHARDWHIVDSMTVRLDDALFEEYPGAGEYAALKVHKRFSVGLGTMVDFHLSAAREHDARHLTIDESWRGLGLLVDLGYASIQLLLDCQQHGVAFVLRLKDSWKPKVDRITRGEVRRTFFPGTDLDALLDEGVLVLDGRVVDAQVTIGPPGRQVKCRLVGVPAPDDGTYRFYLTNLAKSVGPHAVADIYRVRWEIESDNKVDKSCNRLDEIGARTAPAARALVHASLVSTMLGCLIAHRHRLREKRPPRQGAERTSAPIHPHLLALNMGFTALRIAKTMELPDSQARPEWQSIAEFLVHLGRDPNWRRSPSVLDQLRGWRITPGAPRRKRIAPSTRKALK